MTQIREDRERLFAIKSLLQCRLVKSMRCVVLDAMGVIFRAADDVAELLVPFVREFGGSTDSAAVAAAYHAASLGAIDADGFWRRVGLDPAVEAAYLSRHVLMPGVEWFLADAAARRVPVWCLSNDVDRWSRKLRTKFDIDNWLAGAVISGAVGARKPDRAIYRHLLDRSGYAACDLLFIDDRAPNVEAAIAPGIPSRQFEPTGGFRGLLE